MNHTNTMTTMDILSWSCPWGWSQHSFYMVSVSSWFNPVNSKIFWSPNLVLVLCWSPYPRDFHGLGWSDLDYIFVFNTMSSGCNLNQSTSCRIPRHPPSKNCNIFSNNKTRLHCSMSHTIILVGVPGSVWQSSRRNFNAAEALPDWHRVTVRELTGWLTILSTSQGSCASGHLASAAGLCEF